MTSFLRLLAESDKAAALSEICSRQRAEGSRQSVSFSALITPQPTAFCLLPSSRSTP